jgi:acid phosphatase family membrane protein YuiD
MSAMCVLVLMALLCVLDASPLTSLRRQAGTHAHTLHQHLAVLVHAAGMDAPKEEDYDFNARVNK